METIQAPVTLQERARRIRLSVLAMVHRAQSSHVGSALSMADLLAALYFDVLRVDPRNPTDPTRDRFILSKGHGCSALYASLVERGFCDASILEGYYMDGGKLGGHPILGSMPGIEASTGSLGHGLSIGVGMALANRHAGYDNSVYVLMGDGECNEGSVWEAALFAAAQGLERLTAIVDYNKLQGLGRTDAITHMAPLADKWRAFGWEVQEIDGHDMEAILTALKAPRSGRPRVVVAHTVKGKGVSFMEDQLAWHYKSTSEALYTQARQELGEDA